MADKLTPEQKAADAVETKRLIALGTAKLMQDPAYRAAIVGDANEKAEITRLARHGAEMRGFSDGTTLARAVGQFQVKRAVADMAAAEGRNANGAKVAPPLTPPAVGAADDTAQNASA